MNQSKQAVVIGAGVIGLTTALRIQEKCGYAVSIIAEVLPTDPKSIKYTSHWAGASHVSIARNDPRQLALDKETFRVMWEMSKPGSPTENCFLRLTEVEYYHQQFDEPHYLSWMPNFRTLEKSELAPGTSCGVSFTTMTIDSPVYLRYLLNRFLANGGQLVRGSVQHVDQVIEGGANQFTGGKPSPPDVVVVCTGLGARTLGGVADQSVYPIRGQTVVVRAPWIKFGRTISSLDGLWTYIIPRRSGDVIVGGIKESNDYYPSPRPETTTDILERGFALCPELAPPSIRALREPTIDDVRAIIKEEGCGLRPARIGNKVRIDVTYRGNIPVICNFGHGGMGYQSSWGSAAAAVALLEETFVQPMARL